MRVEGFTSKTTEASVIGTTGANESKQKGDHNVFTHAQKIRIVKTADAG